jgi:hypothetical protein
MKKIDLIGLPSGQIMEVTERQFQTLKKEGLINKIKKYKGFGLYVDIDSWCFADKSYQDVFLTALSVALEKDM